MVGAMSGCWPARDFHHVYEHAQQTSTSASVLARQAAVRYGVMHGGESERLPASQLTAQDYSPTDHLDALFPSLESLSLLPRIESKLIRHEIQLRHAIAEMQERVTANKEIAAECVGRVEEKLKLLHDEISTTQAKAGQAEDFVSSVTKEIRRLDTAKRNVAATMTIVKRLQMLISAFDQLQRLASSKKYAETASLLSAVLQLMTHFKAYRSIPQIAVLSQEIADLQRSLLEQVASDFEGYFSTGLSPQTRIVLTQGCQLVEVLGDGPKERISTWYINSQLREYRNVFRGHEEAGSLDNLSRRYAWLKRVFRSYEDEHAQIFPESWHLQEQLIRQGCESTKEDLVTVMARSRPNIKLLLQALQETLDFERYLGERMGAAPRASIDSVKSVHSDASDKQQRGYRISEAFEPYLNLFVDMQDQVLSGMLAGYRSAPWPTLDEPALPSSADLFYFYLTTTTQCAEISTGAPLWEFAKVMAKYLNQYHDLILASKYSNGVVTVEEIIMVLRTAEYCSETTLQLEERIKQLISPPFVERITYQYQHSQFLSLMGRSMDLLVSHLDRVVDTALRDMLKISWSSMSESGDQSQYVSLLSAGLLREGKRVLHNLGKDRFIRSFCDRLVENFVRCYSGYIVKCKPINEVAAEQMLLDIYSIKATLLNLPGAETTAAYAAIVSKQIGRLETLLKVLHVSVNPPEGFVANYIFIIADASVGNFVKVLDIKGVSRQQHGRLIDVFNKQVNAARREDPASLDNSHPLLDKLQVLGDARSPVESHSGIFSKDGLLGGLTHGSAGGIAGIGGGSHGLGSPVHSPVHERQSYFRSPSTAQARPPPEGVKQSMQSDLSSLQSRSSTPGMPLDGRFVERQFGKLFSKRSSSAASLFQGNGNP
ncbi:Vps53-like protein [Protomyces lactucae-debilis]|uniref:Vps53-like protein n=1 Tax=Protomyces lactucae-debilis TaxID=2754530 RepID=A0A1Y2FEA0_PROLT|nr:Vps53-like protein [Protomyces lactucae-debilis]ORY81947.1 Vps53-like protein [Protomyces lactucae-debilis]